MSEYFLQLRDQAKARYVEKLHLLGLAECDDFEGVCQPKPAFAR